MEQSRGAAWRAADKSFQRLFGGRGGVAPTIRVWGQPALWLINSVSNSFIQTKK